jgi:hypothetical protein
VSAAEVPRPRKRDGLRAAKLTALVDAGDFLTCTPMELSGACHPLRGGLATVTRDGVAHDQWQLELPGGARIRFSVTGRTGNTSGTVVLVRVATAHPNGTKK